jgi:hypothetical protein
MGERRKNKRNNTRERRQERREKERELEWVKEGENNPALAPGLY